MNQQQITPNRAQRRAAARARPVEYTSLPEPKLIDKWRIFEGTERILNALASGEVTAENNKPFFKGVTGEVCYIVPALEGWVTFWQYAQKKLNLPIDTTSPFDAIRKRLQHDVILTPRMIASARQALAQQKIYYDTTDRDLLVSLANDVRIKLYLGGVS